MPDYFSDAKKDLFSSTTPSTKSSSQAVTVTETDKALADLGRSFSDERYEKSSHRVVIKKFVIKK